MNSMNADQLMLRAWSGNSNELVTKVTNSVYEASVYLKLAYQLSPLRTQFTIYTNPLVHLRSFTL